LVPLFCKKAAAFSQLFEKIRTKNLCYFRMLLAGRLLKQFFGARVRGGKTVAGIGGGRPVQRDTWHVHRFIPNPVDFLRSERSGAFWRAGVPVAAGG